MTDSTQQSEEAFLPPGDIGEVYGEWDESRDGPVIAAANLCERIEELDLSRSDVLIALELVRLESNRSRPSQFALFYTILASMVSKKRGSVRFDLSAETEGGSLSERLQRNLPELETDPLPTALLTDRAGTPRPDWNALAREVHDLLDDRDALTILGETDESVPLILDDEQLYHQRTFAEERRLADAVNNRILSDSFQSFAPDRSVSADSVTDALQRIHSLSDFELTPKQQYGVLTAVCTPLSLVTGGPGTGKTFIVISIIRLLTELGVSPGDIAIAAPTGKAANRLGETINKELEPSANEWDRRIAEELKDPGTLHRLLGYSEKREGFYHHENRPLPYQYVIVDEASMIDLTLMEQLFSAVADRSSLCLLGDANQLPAVESGAVFRDLVPETISTNVPWRSLAVSPLEKESLNDPEPLSRQSVRLEQNFRVETGGTEAENLLSVSEQLNQGGKELVFLKPDQSSSDPTSICLRKSLENLQFQGVEQFETISCNNVTSSGDFAVSGDRFDRLLRFWYEQWYGEGPMSTESGRMSTVKDEFSVRNDEPDASHTELDRIFRQYNRAQLLSVTRRTPMGSREINQFLHQYHRNNIEGSTTGGFRRYQPGEPIIMTQNDYDRKLFNGDQGIILRVKQEESGSVKPMAVFPGLEGYRAFYLGPLRSQLNHAFALTIHKSQGSEFDHVGIVLPGENVPHFTRELLYTGVTRARQSVTFFGSRDMLKDGARARDERNSGLLERLQQA
jgi:exodeoxyribonuclease V alpha subunit